MGSHTTMKSEHFQSLTPLSGLFELWDRRCQPLGPPEPPAEPGFSGAGVLRIETDRGALAVRSWPTPGLPRVRIEGLHRLLEHVADTVPVAVPLAANGGSRLVEWNSRLWQLEPWMPGVADFRLDPSPERLAEAMATLGRFHRSAREFVPRGDVAEWFGSHSAMPSPAVGERLRRLAAWERGWDTLVLRARGTVSRWEREQGQRDQRGWSEVIGEIDRLFCRGRGWVRRQLSVFVSTLFRCQPCLRDVWHDHLLWTGSQVTGLIDPGSARIDNVAIDVARLLGSLVEDDAQGWERGLEAYERAEGLSLEETGLVTVLDQSGVLLAGAVWVERLADGTVARGSAVRVRRRLEEVVQRMRALVEKTGVV